MMRKAEPKPGPVGRYQLLAAEHLVVGKKTTYNSKDLFKIDTATGETVVLFSTGDDDYWSGIYDDPRAVRDARRSLSAQPAPPAKP
jgi:hypothetical protein